ncbi:MAG: RNA polymerase sigma factor [Aurantibacter sp.]
MSKAVVHIDRDLVSQLKTGDEKAFEQLFDKYQCDVFRYAHSLIKSEEHAKEVVQDVFVKIWLKRETLRPELSFKSFLFTITKNLSYNFLVKASNDLKLKKDVFYHTSHFHTPIENHMLNLEYKVLKQQAINSLSPKRKRIFEMSRIEGKSYKDISAELGITTQTVKNQMSQALGNISGYLESYGEITLGLILPFLIF